MLGIVWVDHRLAIQPGEQPIAARQATALGVAGYLRGECLDFATTVRAMPLSGTANDSVDDPCAAGDTRPSKNRLRGSRRHDHRPRGRALEADRGGGRDVAGQHQSDALAALVVAHDVLVHSAGAQMHTFSPLDVARRAR
jgi:hypothetical protein